MEKIRKTPLHWDEIRESKIAISNLSELAGKQLLFSIVQILSLRITLKKEQFLDILDDAIKYDQIIKKSLITPRE